MKWILLLLVISCAHAPGEYLAFKYQDLLKKNEVKDVMTTCARIDLKSHPMSWYFRNNIRNNNSDLTKPNFNGHYHLLESPLSGGSNWFVADCKTGKVKGTDLVGDLLFNAHSSVLVRNPPDVDATYDTYEDEMPATGYPEVYKWMNDEMVLQKNRIQPANKL